MTVNQMNIALAGLTVVGATLLVCVFALGLAGVQSAGGLSFVLAVLFVIGALLVGPYRRVGI